MTNTSTFFSLDDPALAWMTDPRDRALVGLTPVLPAPRFGPLPELVVGQYRFVLAANGLFVQARSHTMYVCAQIASTPCLPYGEISGTVALAGGPIPTQLARTSIEHACHAAPSEWAGLILYDPGRGYRLLEPLPDSVSSGHIQYHLSGIDPDLIAIDMHSHGHGAAYFSATDDKDDRNGLYIACVFGRCHDPDKVETATRICCHGITIDVPWTPWGDL